VGSETGAKNFLMDPFFSGSKLGATKGTVLLVPPKHVSPAGLLPPMLFKDDAGHLIR
jgi:L-ascorbate metabolism protein UlaG (beta-lactamase superfamily)